MQVHRSYQAVSGSKAPLQKEDSTCFVVTSLSHEEACQNPETLTQEKSSFPTYTSLVEAKQEALKTINQLKTLEKSPEITSYIWKTDIEKWTHFLELPNSTNDITRCFKQLGIKDQWKFNPSTNQFMPIPITYIPQQETVIPQFQGPTYTPKIVPINTPPSEQKLAKILDKAIQNKRLAPCITCPLSKKPYQYPVITPSGHTYNQYHLDQHLLTFHKDPLAKTPLSPKQCISNKTFTEILIHLKDIFTGNKKWLLCPLSKLPISNPVVINTSLTQLPTNLEEGISYSRDILLQNYPMLTEDVLIPNKALSKLLQAFEEIEQNHLSH